MFVACDHARGLTLAEAISRPPNTAYMIFTICVVVGVMLQCLHMRRVANRHGVLTPYQLCCAPCVVDDGFHLAGIAATEKVAGMVLALPDLEAARSLYQQPQARVGAGGIAQPPERSSWLARRERKSMVNSKLSVAVRLMRRGSRGGGLTAEASSAHASNEGGQSEGGGRAGGDTLGARAPMTAPTVVMDEAKMEEGGQVLRSCDSAAQETSTEQPKVEEGGHHSRLAHGTQAPKEHLVADAIFRKLAGSTANAVELSVVVDYLVDRGDMKLDVVQDIVSKLDANSDGSIDRDEWRLGFSAGLLPR